MALLSQIFLWPGGLLSAGVDPNATPQKRLPSATRFLTSQDSAHRVCGSSREDSPPRALALAFFPALIRNNGTACHQELGGGPQRPDLPSVFCPHNQTCSQASASLAQEENQQDVGFPAQFSERGK